MNTIEDQIRDRIAHNLYTYRFNNKQFEESDRQRNELDSADFELRRMHNPYLPAGDQAAAMQDRAYRASRRFRMELCAILETNTATRPDPDELENWYSQQFLA